MNLHYNDPLYLSKHVLTIEDLKNIIIDRKKAYNEGKVLHTIVGYKNFVLSNTGGLHQVVDFPEIKKLEYIPRFILMDDLIQEGKSQYSGFSISHSLFPFYVDYTVECSYCKQLLTLETVNCFDKDHNHFECISKVINVETRYKLETSLRELDFTILEVIETPNQYRSQSYRGSWYIFKTTKGTFMIGWRKRVIEFTFCDRILDLNLLDEFNNTTGSNYFHAWGYQQLKEMLLCLNL